MDQPDLAPAKGARRSRAGRPLVVCATLDLGPTWNWFSPVFDRIRWVFFGAGPRNWLERKVTRPSLAAWGACWRASRAARRRDAALFISHDARITFRSAASLRMQGVRVPHVAWGFNFTTLPKGPARRLMASAFRRVDRFVAYSSFERTLYADYFGIDPARIDVVLWGVGHPEVESAEVPLEPGEYLCAVGGNARDYRTLFAAMARVPEVPLVAVLRPENAAALDVPANVRLRFDLPIGRANNIIAHSRFMVLPLAGTEVPCGHVTLVAAMYLKKALVITNSRGVSDYIEDGVNALSIPAGDADGLAGRIRELWNDPARARRMGEAGYAFAMAQCTEEPIINHLRKVLTDYGLPA
jgi:glycosyltransferase involved in cell wall biosynthesis